MTEFGIQQLEDVLAKARRGEVTSFAMIAVREGKLTIAYSEAGGLNEIALGVARLHYELALDPGGDDPASNFPARALNW